MSRKIRDTATLTALDALRDAGWREEDHPRDPDGKFGAGGGGGLGGPGAAKARQAAMKPMTPEQYQRMAETVQRQTKEEIAKGPVGNRPRKKSSVPRAKNYTESLQNQLHQELKKQKR